MRLYRMVMKERTWASSWWVIQAIVHCKLSHPFTPLPTLVTPVWVIEETLRVLDGGE